MAPDFRPTPRYDGLKGTATLFDHPGSVASPRCFECEYVCGVDTMSLKDGAGCTATPNSRLCKLESRFGRTTE